MNFTYEYLPWRGITKESFKFFDCKTKINEEGVPVAVGYRYPNSAYKVRLLDKKEFYTEGDIAKAGLFGKDKFLDTSKKFVTITEGELDAISTYQCMRTPSVSVQSAATALRDCSMEREWLNSFEKVYLCFDNDERGRDATRAVASLFDYNKVFVVKLTKHKDANDYVRVGDDQELRDCWWNAKRYLPDTITSTLSEFRELLQVPQKGVAYPFKQLTDMTYGIRTGESVLITAQEGVGKTEVMHAIEYKLLTETEDNVAAIFLEEPRQRHLQALAGIHLQRPVHLPDSGCTVDETCNAVAEVVRKDERLHLYSHFGSDDPKLLLDTIRFLVVARACRYLLLDHITMVVSGLAGEDERRALDFFATNIEMLVKELDFALLIVSHVNDNGQTRGSRLISKIADVRIDIARDVLSPDPVSRSTMEFTISKNRPVGLTGPAGNAVFNQVTRRFNEGIYHAPASNDNGLLKAVA